MHSIMRRVVKYSFDSECAELSLEPGAARYFFVCLSQPPEADIFTATLRTIKEQVANDWAPFSAGLRVSGLGFRASKVAETAPGIPGVAKDNLPFNADIEARCVCVLGANPEVLTYSLEAPKGLQNWSI